MLCLIDYDPALLQAPQPSQGTYYDVIVQPYEGIPTAVSWRHTPDVATVRVNHVIQVPAVTRHKRDILWVECKAPSEDQPSDWRDVMREAVTRLSVIHPTTELFFILNVGMEWMVFYWDPTNPLPAGQELTITSHAASMTWTMDPRVRPPPNIPSDHITNRSIATTRAKTLDCFTLAQNADNQMVFAHQADLDFLEQIIITVANHHYTGQNDPFFE